MKLYAVTDEYIDYLRQFDYKDNKIRKSIVPIVRIVSNEEIDNVPVLIWALYFL
ncbi:MAG: hypothetical protein HFJ48_03190 [Clostridia bacterium]|nr:hypothetical protein [Clostridia bacterium]